MILTRVLEFLTQLMLSEGIVVKNHEHDLSALRGVRELSF